MKALHIVKWIVITAISSVLLLEGVLQLGAWVMHDSQRTGGAFLSMDNTLRVLAVGDSHTYGQYLEANEAYPAQLQQQWAATPHQRALEVINVGFPGTNSSRVLSNIDTLLNTFKPDVVVLLVGINDYWTEPVDLPGDVAEKAAVLQWLSQHSRVYKLCYLIQRQRYNADKLAVNNSARELKWSPALAEEFKQKITDGPDAKHDIPNAISYGDTEFSIGYRASAIRHDKPMQHLFKNLLKIIAITQQHNVRLVLMTYENDTDLLFKTVNTQVRKAADKQHITALELAPAFSQHCQDLNHCDWLFPDFHPTAAGQSEIATLVMAVLQQP